MRTNLLIMLTVAIAIAIAVFAVGDSQQELEDELSNLTQELVDANYSWLVNYSGGAGSVFYENYSCNSTGYHIVKVLTEGKHHQLFEFGGMNASAHNLATAGGTTKTTHTTKADFDTGTYLNGSYANGTTSTNVDGNLKMVTYGGPSDLDASMVLWMHMNNDSGYGENDTRVYDFSGNGNNGTVTDATYNATGGKFGGGFEFDGDGDYVSIGDINNLDGSSEITVSLWFKPNTDQTSSLDYHLVDKNKNVIGMYFYPTIDDFKIDLTTTSGNKAVYTYGLTWNSGEWHHIVGTYNGTDIILYWDGQFESSDTHNGTIVGNAQDLMIGSNWPGSGDYFNGSIDELSIYNRSLSASEINALYMAGNETHPNVNTTNWTSPILDSGKAGSNWTTIEWDAVQTDRANVSRTSELVYDPSMVLWMHMNNDSDHCYDDETEILTDEGWKLFKDLDETEEVATLNQGTGALEWEVPASYFEFDSPEFMFEIETDDGDLVVSPGHRVYVGEGSSEVGKSEMGEGREATVVFSEESLENQELVGLVVMNESVKNDNILFNFEYEDETSDMNSFVIFQVSPEIFEMINNDNVRVSDLINLLLNSPEQGEVFFLEFNEGFFNKRSINSHTDSHQLLNSSRVFGFISPDLSFLEVCSMDSTTSLTTDGLTSLLSLSEIPDTSVISDNFKLFTNCRTTLAKANSNSCLNSTGMSTLTTISSMKDRIGGDYLNFSLQPIKEVYSDFENGDEIYFLDSSNEPVRVLGIEKVDYDGKIYDVDVGNDVVLVRRDDSEGIWSGNSENDTHVYDFSGNGNNGSVVNDTTWNSSGKFGGAYEFNGNDNFVQIPDDASLEGMSAITVSTWIKPTLTGEDYQRIVDKSTDYVLYVHTDGIVCLELITTGTGGGSSDWYSNEFGHSAVVADVWTHVLFVWDDITGEANVYINGVSGVAQTRDGDVVSTSVYDLRIGDNPTGTRSFNGTIDEVAIYNRSLSAEEIRNMYYEDVVKFQTRTASTEAGVSSATWSDYLPIDGVSQDLGLCVAEDSLIRMADGTMKEIWEIEAGDEVLSLDEKSGKLVSNEVKELFDMGVKPIYEVVTESGRRINTTGNHPYLVVRGGERFSVWDWVLEKVRGVMGNG